MSVTKDFVAKIAVGIRGIALMEITETLSPHSVQTRDFDSDLIIQDISDNGIEYWADHVLTDIPTDPGVYTFRGSARFDEDSYDYSVTCDEI